MDTSSAEDIASLCIHKGPKGLEIQVGQTEHRIAIVSKWDIQKGSKILELGCGQGDCTAVLADTVGPNGHVTAVDPGLLDYGAPFTLGQAQSHLSSGRLGERITWKQADPLEFLKSDDFEYDVAVLALCTWYFASPTVLSDTLRLIHKRARRVCIAEWSLSSASADTHILSVLAQAALECRKPTTVSNVRTVISPARIKELAEGVDLKVLSEALVTPGDAVLDGKWEVGAVMDPGFLKEVDKLVKDEKEKSMVVAFRDAVEASLNRVKQDGKTVRSMDVWCAIFERKAT